MFAWETTPGYAVHLLNYTNPNAHHGWMQSSYPLGPQTVRMKMPKGVKVKSVELLQAELTVAFMQCGKPGPQIHDTARRRLRSGRHHDHLTNP